MAKIVTQAHFRVSSLAQPMQFGVRIGTGALSAILAIIASLVIPWPADPVWRIATSGLFGVAVATYAAGATAGLASAALNLYDSSFVEPSVRTHLWHVPEWSAALTVVSLALVVGIGGARKRVDRQAEELNCARAMLQRANRALEAMSGPPSLGMCYDRVTDLPSRPLVIDRFGQMAAQARRNQTLIGVVQVDLRRIKNALLPMGQDAVDEALRQVGSRISNSVRRADTVGRLGADSLIVLLTGLADPAGVSVAGLKLAAALAAPVQVGYPPRSLEVVVPLGSAVFPLDSEDWEDLYRLAEESARTPSFAESA